MLYTTLNQIREFSPYEDGWKQLLTYLNKTKAEDEKLDFKTILDYVGIKAVIWCLRTQDFKDYYKFIVRVAYSVLPIFENKYPDDNRPRLAIEAVEKFMNGEISKEELEETRTAARAAAYAAGDAADATWAAKAPATAAWAAAWAAADAAGVWAAAYAYAYAARDYADAAGDAARAARDYADAKKEKWKEIEQIFIEECLN